MQEFGEDAHRRSSDTHDIDKSRTISQSHRPQHQADDNNNNQSSSTPVASHRRRKKK